MKKRKKSPERKAKERAWSWFSKYRRLLFATVDGYCMCVTCGVVKHWKELQAGHYVDGRNNTVLFMEELVYPQCFKCNSKRPGCEAGNKIKFTAFLMKKGYVIEQLDNFDNLKFKTKKMILQDFEEIEAKYKEKFNKLLTERGGSCVEMLT